MEVFVAASLLYALEEFVPVLERLARPLTFKAESIAAETVMAQLAIELPDDFVATSNFVEQPVTEVKLERLAQTIGRQVDLRLELGERAALQVAKEPEHPCHQFGDVGEGLG